jgi:phosphatidate cytidylyltransferase
MGPLTKRILVAVPGIAGLLALTFWSWTLPFRLVVAVALGLALWEYFNLTDAHRLNTLRLEGSLALVLTLLPLVLQQWIHWNDYDSFWMGLFILTLSFLWSKRPLKEMVVSVSVTFFGVAYFGILGRYFFLLRDVPQGPWLLVWLYIATWAYDTGGYFAGRFWGKHHFAPLASPKKSVEGCVGGFVLTLASLLALWKWAPVLSGLFSLSDVLILSALLSVFGQLGDLVESIIKRSLSAKDSGSLLPGHGGVFDRIDSLLFNAPVLFYYLYYHFMLDPK